MKGGEKERKTEKGRERERPENMRDIAETFCSITCCCDLLLKTPLSKKKKQVGDLMGGGGGGGL